MARRFPPAWSVHLMIFFRDPGVCRLYPKKEDNQANEGDGGQQSSRVEWAVGC